MTLIGLLKKLKGACQFPVKGIYFRILGKELSNDLVEIKDDSNLADCIALAFKNEKLIEIYLEHHGYKVVDDVLYLEFDPSLPWNEMKPTLGTEVLNLGKKGKGVQSPDRNLNSWCRAFFKMDRGCGAYENGIFKSYHNFIRIARDTITPSIRKQIEHLKITLRYWTVCPCGDNNYEVRKGDESFGVNIDKRTCSCNWWTLSGVPCVHTVAAYCFIKSDPTLGVSPCHEVGEAGPITAAGSATVVDESGPTGVDECVPTGVDESDRTSMKEVVEASIAAGTLKLAGLKKRSKSESIANKAKAFKFGKDGAGSTADKA
nr:hypothetical protein CTI12_AA159120 [Tanacetum cinerariifolium]